MSGRLFQSTFGPTLRFSALFAFLIVGVSMSPLHARTFRVEIEIRDEGGGEISKHLVLFKDDIVYDFALSEPHDVTVIDGERVTLISRREQIKASVPNDVLVEATARAKADAETRGQSESLGLAAEPQRNGATYTLAFDHGGGRYGYEVSTTKPLHAEQASRFAEFSDWMCRINLVRRMGPLPPFARMKLSRVIAGDGVVPTEVALDCTSNQVKRTFISKYIFSEELSQADDQRISEIAGWMQRYRDVPFEEYPR
ncbi:MAG: hypothetical protein AAFU85_13510 [Planctomycetota bacterium]